MQLKWQQLSACRLSVRSRSVYTATCRAADAWFDASAQRGLSGVTIAQIQPSGLIGHQRVPMF